MAASASTSNAAEISNSNYHVFIGHSSSNVKNSLGSLLYRRLLSEGLRVFLDLFELGYTAANRMIRDFSPLPSAIRTASLHVVIFTPDYVGFWSLDDLVLMLESAAPIIPVYYGVKPSDLRLERREGVYGRALQKLEDERALSGRRLNTPDRIEKWRNALSRVAEMSGFELDAFNGDEGELLDKLLERVLKKVKREAPLHVAIYPTGLDLKLKEFSKTVSVQQQQDIAVAKVVGIVGIGGVGKTTLAKEFFNRNRSNYKRSSFLFDVREHASGGSLNLLQSKLLKDLTSFDNPIYSVNEGIGMLPRYIAGSQVLIVLDDVDDVEQVHALVSPVKDVLRSDSLILVTSRDKDVLRNSGIEESSIYKSTGLDRQHSEELFCMHAFQQPHPLVGFEEMVREFLDACHGSPLSLKVLGALLFEKNDLEYWKYQLERIPRVLPTDVQRRLKISYDSLHQEEKEIFLDISCFFIGEDKDKAIRIWDGSGWEGSMGLLNLQNKCLVEIDRKNCIRMHDHLRDLGRALAKEEPRGRLWRPTDNLFNNVIYQSASVRGINLVQRRSDNPFTFNDRLVDMGNRLSNITFSNRSVDMRGLQLVRAEGDCLGISIFNPLKQSDLVWLHWDNYPHTSLPFWIPKQNLRVLEVARGNLKTLWQNKSEAPLELRELNIGATLLRVPESIGQLKHLEKIEMNDIIEALPEEFFHLPSLKQLRLRTRMMSLPDSLGNLTNLGHFDLSGCKDLQTLPPSLGNLTKLKHINLNECCRLQMLPNSFGNLVRLNRLSLAGCSALTISSRTFGKINKLESLDLSGCGKVEVLPPQVANQRFLEEINLSHTNLKELPAAIGSLCNLEILKLQCPSLEMLPTSLGNLTSLMELTLNFCDKLRCLPDSIAGLKQLTTLTINYASIEYLPAGVMELNNLETLIARSCPLCEVPFGRSVENVGLVDSTRMVELKHLDLQGTAIREISFQEGVCPNLQILNISFCHELEEVGALPATLMELDLQESFALKKITGLSVLVKLRRLNISRCEEVEELPGIETLTSLEELRVAGCRKLKGTPIIHMKRKGKSQAEASINNPYEKKNKLGNHVFM